MKICVAIPCYDRKMTCETARSLLIEQALSVTLGVQMEVMFTPGCSLITHARNSAVQDFMDSDADRLVFLDSDIAWEPGALLRLAAYPVEFVGGAYRYKDADENYPIHWLDRPELWSDPETGLLEVRALPGGFLSLSRSVFEKLAAAHPTRAYFHHGKAFQAFFHVPPGAGEDGQFCLDWIDAGGKVWLDPTLTLTHVDGAQKYTGNIGAWLRRNAGIEPLEKAA